MRFSLYADERGAGPRLLLLHGLGASGSAWASVARTLAAHQRVLIPDLLGFGRSPWPDELAYSVEDHLAALEQLLAQRAWAESSFNIAGHSLGAILAAELAARRPERVSGLVLVSLPYFRSNAEAHDRVAHLGLIARLTAEGHWAAAALCRVMCAMRPALRVALPYATPNLPDEVARDGVMHTWASYSRSLHNVILRHRLDGALAALADRQVLLIHGEADTTAPLQNVRDLVARFPAWRLEVVVGGGHHLPFEQPALLAELLQAALLPATRDV